VLCLGTHLKMSSTGFLKPSDARAKFEAKIASEGRSDELKAREFTQNAGASAKRANDISGFSAKPSQVKAGWESKVEYESKNEQQQR